jgi:hypothetical protein
MSAESRFSGMFFQGEAAWDARGAVSWALPSVALALLPKCPMCIAAWLAIGGGLGVSFTTLAHLRTSLICLCWSALLLLTARLVMRFTHGIRTAPQSR